MNDNLILIIAILVSAGIGAYIGLTMAKLKSKGEQSALEERQNQLNQNISSLKETLTKVETERENIRKEKDILNGELVRRN